MIGTGAHVHPGGLGMTVENYGSEENPCRDDGQGYGGTLLLDSDVVWHHGVKFTEDYQTEVTNPAWRAPIHEGDRIRISSYYENKKHAWYEAMAHEGTYIDTAQPPKGRCKPYLVGPTAKLKGKKKVDVTEGVRNRAWSMNSTEHVCGKRYGRPACDRPMEDLATGPPAEHGDDRELPIQTGRPVPVGDRRPAAGGAAGQLADLPQRGPVPQHPPLGDHLPLALQRAVPGQLPAPRRDLGLGDARLRPDLGRQPEPGRRDAARPEGRAGTRTSAASTRSCAGAFEVVPK